MARLPVVGSDQDAWGSLLNAFLAVAFNADGTLNSTAARSAVGDLSAIVAANPTAGDVAMNSHKVTGLANGSAATDAVAYGQLSGYAPASGSPNYEQIGKGTVAANWGGPIDVTQSPYNAKFDNTTDDTAAIQAALNDASLAWYGLTGNDQVARAVLLPPGRARIAGTLTIPTNVWLRGHGKSATYLNKTGAGMTNAPVIQLAAGGVQVKLSDFGIISSVTASAGGAAVELTGGNNPSILGDQACIIQNVVIYGHYDGIHDGGTENRYYGVHCYNQQRHGFNIGATDCFLQGCTAANSGQVNNPTDTATAGGFNITGPNTRLYGCKAFGGKGIASGTSGGFLILSRCELVACEAQDMQGYGFIETGGQTSTFSGCLADSCGQGGYFPGQGSTYSGCVALNRGGAYTMPHAVKIWAGNVAYFKGMATSNVRRADVGSPQNSGGFFDFDNRYGCQVVAYAATITPDPWLGGQVYVGTLTAAVTIANPQSNPTNGADGTSAWYQQGQELDLVLPQDATGGRTVTFGTFYKTTGAIPTTASSVTQIKFRYDGTNWREVSRATT